MSACQFIKDKHTHYHCVAYTKRDNVYILYCVVLYCILCIRPKIKYLFCYVLLLPIIYVYIEIYNSNRKHGKGVWLRVRKLSYSPPRAYIKQSHPHGNIACIELKKNKDNLQEKKLDQNDEERVWGKDISVGGLLVFETFCSFNVMMDCIYYDNIFTT